MFSLKGIRTNLDSLVFKFLFLQNTTNSAKSQAKSHTTLAVFFFIVPVEESENGRRTALVREVPSWRTAATSRQVFHLRFGEIST